MRKYLPIKIHHIYFGNGLWFGSKVYFRDGVYGGLNILPIEYICTTSCYRSNWRRIGDGDIKSWSQSRQRQNEIQ